MFFISIVINVNLDSATSKEEEENTEFSDKVLISPAKSITPLAEQKDEQPGKIE